MDRRHLARPPDQGNHGVARTLTEQVTDIAVGVAGAVAAGQQAGLADMRTDGFRDGGMAPGERGAGGIGGCCTCIPGAGNGAPGACATAAPAVNSASPAPATTMFRIETSLSAGRNAPDT